jgi:hypothetical protein
MTPLPSAYTIDPKFQPPFDFSASGNRSDLGVLSMGRDWEINVYIEHRPLTAALLDPLFRNLARAGLMVGAPDAEKYPALAGFNLDGPTPTMRFDVLDQLFRSKEPPVGAAYGIIPLQASGVGPGISAVHLSFARPDPVTGLDGVNMVIDGALFRADEDVALDAAFEWFAILSGHLDAVYGWADWETATFLVAAPSRRDIRSGSVPRLLRFNALGPSLHTVVDVGTIERSATRFRRLATGTVLFEAGEHAAGWNVST